MKTYVLTLSKTFPATHPRHGEPTEFLEKFLNGQTGTFGVQKLHTIRANYQLWEKRVKEVQNGKAVLSVRQWSGRPYASKQVTVATLTAADGVGIQPLEIIDYRKGHLYSIWEKGKYPYNVDPGKLALNDGLTPKDWLAWFKDYDCSQPLAIIHFTSFRY